MPISEGMRLPDAALIKAGAGGFEQVSLSDYLAGRRVVLFALPGAFSGDCSTIHLPSFIRVADDLRAKGVDEIICLAVNDPFVLSAWAESTGGAAAGITFLSDYGAELTRALGMAFTAPPIGLVDRSNRYALLVEDGVVTIANVDDPAICDISTGERLVERIAA